MVKIEVMWKIGHIFEFPIPLFILYTAFVAHMDKKKTNSDFEFEEMNIAYFDIVHFKGHSVLMVKLLIFISKVACSISFTYTFF